MKIKSFGFMAKLMTVLAGIFMFASFSPSLDGRAVVVDEGVMPSGMFAKTVGYLPGDVISVSNANGTGTVDLLVIGALDPSEGVAIMLTPEAAKEVGISKNSNNIVKITKRNSQDERVYGNAVVSTAGELSGEPEKVVKNEPEEIATNPTPYREELFEDSAENPASSVVAAEADGVYEPVAAVPYVEVLNEETEETAEAAEDFANVYAEPVEKAPASAVAEREARLEPEVTETVPAPVYAYKDELPSEKAFDEEETEAAAENQETVMFAEVPSASYEDEYTEETDDDTYEAIVLVPAGANPPAKDDAEKSVLPAVAENVSDDDVINYYDDEQTDTPVVTKTDAVQPAVEDYSSYVVSSLSDLKRNSYYVQVALLSEPANIQQFISRYGKNYPVTIVPTSNGKANQILIGSLSVDEYAVVLERFKSYGYKDAFLRKVK